MDSLCITYLVFFWVEVFFYLVYAVTQCFVPHCLSICSYGDVKDEFVVYLSCFFLVVSLFSLLSH